MSVVPAFAAWASQAGVDVSHHPVVLFPVLSAVWLLSVSVLRLLPVSVVNRKTVYPVHVGKIRIVALLMLAPGANHQTEYVLALHKRFGECNNPPCHHDLPVSTTLRLGYGTW
jgi:hypothetical protein